MKCKNCGKEIRLPTTPKDTQYPYYHLETSNFYCKYPGPSFWTGSGAAIDETFQVLTTLTKYES